MQLANWQLAIVAAIGLISSGPVGAEEPPQTPIDYGQPATWLCRPGNDGICTTGLDALIVGADGTRTPQPFAPAADPPIDCFYVYPTVSKQKAVYADMAPSDEIQAVAKAQAGRLSSRCRLFVPLYRQMTLAGIFSGAQLDLDSPYRDILAAWRWYMAHDNHGRGIVLVGHSQGTMLLQRLIAEEIDGKPVQAQLVSAFLAGNLSLPVPKGKTVGGALKHVPLCTAAAQTGCVYSWASYAATDTQGSRLFGGSPGPGLESACVNPAAPGGGKGPLKAYLPKPAMAPANDPPWLEVVGQLSATCAADDQGNVLRIQTEPSEFADILQMLFQRVGARPGWGLHRLDVGLPLGNMLDDIDAETKAWPKH